MVDNLGGKHPVLDRGNHVLADTQGHSSVVLLKNIGIFAPGLVTFGQPAKAQGEGFMPPKGGTVTVKRDHRVCPLD